MQLTTITATGTKGKMSASDVVFAAKVNQVLMAQAVRVYIANSHGGSSAAQTRSEVSRTKKKWFKQKGTGNARHGARSSNIFVGGGSAHGPKKEQHLTLSLSKNLKKKALISALSFRAKDILVCDAVAKLEGKTKAGAALINKVSSDAKKLTVILGTVSDIVLRSLQNLENVEVLEARSLNTLDVLDTAVLLMDKEAVKLLEERLSDKKKKDSIASLQNDKKKPVKKKAASSTSSETAKEKNN